MIFFFIFVKEKKIKSRYFLQIIIIYFLLICKHLSLIKCIVLHFPHSPAVTVERKQRRRRKKKILFILFFFPLLLFVRLIAWCNHLTKKIKDFFLSFFLFLLQIFIFGQCWIYYYQYDPTTRPFLIIY
jgi:hypothetical protein